MLTGLRLKGLAMVRKSTILERKLNRPSWITNLPPAPPVLNNKKDIIWGLCDKCRNWVPVIDTECAYRICIESWCANCGRGCGGFGNVGCPCSDISQMYGHNTRAEQPKARGRLVPNPNEDVWNPFILIPFSGRNKIHKGW